MGQPLGKPRNLRDIRHGGPPGSDSGSIGLGAMEYNYSNPQSPRLQFGTAVVRESQDFEAHQMTGTKKYVTPSTRFPISLFGECDVRV